MNSYREFYETTYLHSHPVDLSSKGAPYFVQAIQLLLIELQFPCHSLLDVGCGRGNYLKALRHILSLSNCVGIDISRGALTQARRSHSTEDLRFVQARAELLPFVDGCFDLNMAVDVLEHMSEPGIVLQEMRRVSAWALLKIPLEKCWFSGMMGTKLGR